MEPRAAVLCFEGASARARQTSAMLRVIEVPELTAGGAADYIGQQHHTAGTEVRAGVIQRRLIERRKIIGKAQTGRRRKSDH